MLLSLSNRCVCIQGIQPIRKQVLYGSWRMKASARHRRVQAACILGGLDPTRMGASDSQKAAAQAQQRGKYWACMVVFNIAYQLCCIERSGTMTSEMSLSERG